MAFIEDPLLQAGVLYRMHTMAESAYALSAEVRSRHSQVDWRGVRGFRNIVVHACFRELDPERAWQFLENELDKLRTMAEAELRRKGG